MSRIRLSLLGAPTLEVDNQAHSIGRRKALALLAYLALLGEPQTRETLAAQLWPEADARRASASLRNTLYTLRQALGDGIWEEAGENVGLKRGTFWLDVTAFRRLLAESTRHPHEAPELCPACAGALEEALALYRDDFMRGFTLPDAPGFDEWQFFTAEELRQQLADGLQRLVAWQASQEAYEAALTHGRRWLALDPLHEPPQRAVMALYALAGQRPAALRQYQACQRLLGEELGIQPEPATVELYEAIRTRRFPGSWVATLPWSGQGAGPAPPGPAARPPFFDSDEEAPVTAGSSAFVGRERQLERLHRVLKSALGGQGQPIFVVGGAGRGKTMLVREFHRQAQASEDGLLVAIGNGNAHTGIGDPYLPFRQALAMLMGDVEAGWAGGLISSSHARRLWEAMPLTLPVLAAHGPDLVGHFVPVQGLQARAAALPAEDGGWRSRLGTIAKDPHRGNLQQQRIFSQYAAVLYTLAEQRPVLLILEDLHWIDAASASLLFHLCRELLGSRILIAGTYRPDEVATSLTGTRHPLAGILAELKRQHGDIWLDLGQLAREDGQQFVDDYLDAEPNRLDQAFRQALFQHTGGHALFTAELLHALQERGDLHQDGDGRWVAERVIDWEALPAKVEGAIEQRLGQLNAEELAILTAASVEGERFTAEVVARSQRLPERAVVRRLSQVLDKKRRLVTAEALERSGDQRLSRYSFRHQLFQHYLYHQLDEMERSYLHEAVGVALEALYGDETGHVASQLARHFQGAGIFPKAVTYLTMAGSSALRLSAYQEAIAHLRSGLTLLEEMPESPDRARQELMTQITLGNALIASRGYAAPEVKETYDRARQLCQQVGEAPRLLAVLYGLWAFYMLSGNHQDAYDVAREFLSAAQRQGDEGALMVAHRAIGQSDLIFGNLVAARTHQEQSFALYNPERHHGLAFVYGQDPGAGALLYLAWILWILGYPDQGRRRMEEALSLADQLAHPMTSAQVLSAATTLYLWLREPQEVVRLADAAVQLCTEHGIPFFLAWSSITRAAALSDMGHGEEAIGQLRHALAIYERIGAGAGVPMFLLSLAEALYRDGQTGAAFGALEEGVKRATTSGEVAGLAEPLRLKGEWMLAQGDEAAGEACLRRALRTARQQSAKSYELRVAMSLARLWAGRGEATEARRLLAGVYEWFTEGFETRDLREARQLLEVLSGMA